MILNDVLHKGAAGAVSLLILMLPACSVVPRKAAAVPGPSPVLSVDYVLADVTDAVGYDLRTLETSTDPAATLRLAWIQLQRQRPQDAIDQGARVLYGAEPVSAQAEAIARYIRAEAFLALGQPQNAQYDRERAAELALDERLRARLACASPAAATRAAEPAPVAAAALPLQSRSAWRPAPAVQGRLDPMGRIFRITVHHSAMLFRDTGADTAASQVRLIQHNHMTQPELRYGDIGYHFVIDPAGRIWQGRELKWQGAHARSSNNVGNIGICVLGNFLRGADGQRPTAAELQSLRTLIATLSRQYGIPGSQIYSHRDFVNTECPGPYLEAEVQRIARAIGSGAATPVAGGRRSATAGGAEAP